MEILPVIPIGWPGTFVVIMDQISKLQVSLLATQRED